MCEPDGHITAPGDGEAIDGGAIVERPSADVQLWVQAHRAAAQAAVATALGVRVLSLDLHDGPPPVGVVTLAAPDAAAAGEADVPADLGRVRLLAYAVAGPIAERVAGVGGVPLQGEAAYHLATSVLTLLRESDASYAQPDAVSAETDEMQIARLLLDRFGERADDAAEAAEHLALNVETWLSQHWGSIAVVAVNLLRHRQLTGEGVRQLMPPSTTATGLIA